MLRAVGVGLAAGFLSGLFGVGGGILIVPALVLVMGLDQRLAHGTSLAAVLPIALASLVGYWTEGEVDWPVALWLALGAVLGAVIGTRLLRMLPHRALAFAFCGLLVVTALRLMLDDSTAGGRDALDAGWAIGLWLIGVATGILSGLLGVGGGIIMVPVMVVLVRIPPALAKGTSLAVIIPTAVMGTWRNREHGNADLAIAAAVGVAGVVSAFAGSKLAVGMSERVSNALFAALLLAVAGQMAYQIAGERRRARATS